MKKHFRITALILALVLCLSMLAACGGSGDTDTQTPDTQAPETQTPAVQEPVVEGPTVKQDISDYLWDTAAGASVEEQITLELRNASLITAMEAIFEAESYSAYSKAVASLRSRKTEETLTAALEAKANLVQISSVADGVYFLWNDFESMPIGDGESYTEEVLDAASLLGYGYTTVLVKYLVDDPSTAKGNIVVVSGGAMKGRSNGTEGYPAVEIFNELGYNCFLLQRRLEPYSTIDIYMDCQRAIRTVRYYAEQEGWGGQDMIAACGWSGGGATILGCLQNCYGDMTPADYDSDYAPDEIDAVSCDLDAALIIYGAYNHDGGELISLENSNLPAFYISHGTADTTIPYENAQTLYDTVAAAGIPASLTLIEGAAHGYGVGTADGLPEECSQWVNEADAFMQANLGYSSAPKYTVSELCFSRDGLNIYGQLAMPAGEGPFPVVILAHGYGGNYTQCMDMAERLASEGVAAYAFDFNGGGRGSSSDGDPMDMSVLTEAADMYAVMDGLAAMPEIDEDNIFLMGFSQGGFVSTYVAAARPDDVKALIAYFPAYVLQSNVEEVLAGLDSDSNEIKVMGMTISRKYYEDLQSFSLFEMMPNYTGDVIIFHGTADVIAPIEYSYQAVETFPSAELVVVEGKTHGNLGADIDDQAVAFILEHIG